MMRIIVAGSRTVDEEQVRTALSLCPWIGFASAVISGTAKGADLFGERWAEERGIEVIRLPADWAKHGRRAGPMRNAVMAERGDGLVAVWDGASAGTKNMIENAVKRGLRVAIYRTDKRELVRIEATDALAAKWEDAEERAALMEFGSGMSRPDAERTAGALARDGSLKASSARSEPSG